MKSTQKKIMQRILSYLLKIKLSRVFLFTWLGVILVSLSWGNIEIRDFKNALQRERYNNLISELRCPKCQNQNLLESNAPISEDMREVIFQSLQEGKTDTEIKEYLVARYGEFILYRPKLSPVTSILWLGPFIIFIFGIVLWLLLVNGRRSK